MMGRPIPEQHALRHFFAVLTEHSFTKFLGWQDRHVTTYISDLLLKFTDRDHLYKIRNRQGVPLATVAEMLYESDILLEASSFEREGEVHRHIGDFTLFMSGIFPQFLQRIKSSGLIHHADFLIDYIKTGKRSYRIAAECQDDTSHHDPSVCHKLSDNFELCVVGLDNVRATLEHMQEANYLKARTVL